LRRFSAARPLHREGLGCARVTSGARLLLSSADGPTAVLPPIGGRCTEAGAFVILFAAELGNAFPAAARCVPAAEHRLRRVHTVPVTPATMEAWCRNLLGGNPQRTR